MSPAGAGSASSGSQRHCYSVPPFLAFPSPFTLAVVWITRHPKLFIIQLLTHLDPFETRPLCGYLCEGTLNYP